MTPFIGALVYDKRFPQDKLDPKPVDNTIEVNKGGLKNRLEFEHVKQRLSHFHEEFLNDLLPGGNAKVELTFLNPQAQWNKEETKVYLWDQYTICTSYNFFGQWLDGQTGVYGDNLLELYIYHTNSHPRDAHRALARKYGWDLSSETVLFQSPTAGYRQTPTMPSDFDFEKRLEFIKELGYSIHRVRKYKNRTGALRGAIVYCQSQDENQLIPIPVVQVERVHPDRIGVDYPHLTKVPAENCVNPNLRYKVHGYPSHVVRQVEIAFFQVPYPLFNEFGLETNKEDIVIISEDEMRVCLLTGFFEKNNISGYLPISWPGGEKAVQDVDWTPLEGRKVGYVIHKADKNSCRLAYRVYQSVKKANPGELRFHLCIKDNGIPESIETAASFAPGYISLCPNDFVKYVWELHGISLTGDLQAADLLSAFTVEEFINQNMAPPNYALAPVFPLPGTAAVIAPRGLGKTFFCLELAKAIATGAIAFGRWDAQLARSVLYIDGEMSAPEMSKRFQLLGLDQAGDKLKIMSASTQGRLIKDLSTPNGQADIEQYLWAHETEVIIIDNLASLAPNSLGNDVECCIPLNNWLCDLKRRGYSVIIVHHATKANSGRGGNQRGSSAKEDILDTVISLEKPKQKRNLAHFDVVFSKARSAYGEAIEPFSVMLTIPEEGESARWEASEYSYCNQPQPKPKASNHPKKTQAEDQALLGEIEAQYQTTSDNEDIIAEKVGLINRGGLNRFLNKYPDAKKRIKEIRRPPRSQTGKTPSQDAITPVSESLDP